MMQRDEQRILRERDHQLGEHDAEPRQRHHPITMPAQAQAGRTPSEFLAPSTIASMMLGSVTLHAGRLAQRRHREAGERSGQRRQRRAVARIHHHQEDEDRKEQVAALGHHDAQPRQLGARHAHEPRRLASKCTAAKQAT